jgi:hypothetical protein
MGGQALQLSHVPTVQQTLAFIHIDISRNKKNILIEVKARMQRALFMLLHC